MASPIPYSIDDKDLDDAALWAVIDSAAASHSKYRKPLAIGYNNPQTPTPVSNLSPIPKCPLKNLKHHNAANNRVLSDGEVLQGPQDYHQQRPQKISRTCGSEMSEGRPLILIKGNRSPATPVYASTEAYLSPEIGKFGIGSECSSGSYVQREENEGPIQQHSLSGRFPSVSLFKEYQNAAMAILEKTDYTVISGSPYIKKSGWRKISFYFNLSYEIKDKNIEFDDNRNVQRAEFIVRAYMQGGRFSDGWGSCERREKRFLKPNHDIPSTAETRAKNKACQDLLGIGEYRPSASQYPRS